MIRIVLGLLLAAMTTLAQAGVQIQHWNLPSGARVYFVESHELPILDVQVDFAAGTAYDPPGKSGLAGMTRGLLDAGAGSLDEEKIAERLVDIGAHLAGSGDLDRAGLSLRTLSSQRERDAALELLRLVLLQPTFPEDVLAREKTRSIAAIREADTRPDSIAAKRFSALLYPGHPYGVSATVDSVASITRDDLVAFHRTRYSAQGAVISIIGDVSRTEAEHIASTLTEGLPQNRVDATLPEVKLPLQSVERIAHPATQAHIHIGVPAMRRGDPDYFAMLVGNYILGGGGFVSRLMQEVREKRGFAYDVHSYVQAQKQPGPFQIGLQTKRNQATDALKVAQDTLTLFLKDGPSERELKAAKRNLVDGFALRLDSNRKILEYLAVIGFYELPLTYLDDFPRKVEAVTVADIRTAFQRKVQPEHLVTVILAGE